MEETLPPASRSKRQLLKTAALLGAVWAIKKVGSEIETIQGAIWWLQQQIAKNGLVIVLDRPELLEPALQALRRKLLVDSEAELRAAGIKPKDNPNFRSLQQEVEGATQAYMNEGGVVTYQRNQHYKDMKFYRETLTGIVTSPSATLKPGEDDYGSVLGLKPAQVVQALNNSLPPGAAGLFNYAHERDRGPFSLLELWEISGIVARALDQAKLSAKFGVGNPNLDQDEKKFRAALLEQLHTPQQAIEKIVAENNGKPVPLSWVILYFLRINNGQLNVALWDSAIFLKFMTRAHSNPQSETPNTPFSDVNLQPGGETWVTKHLRDTINAHCSFNDMPLSTLRLNVAGSLYHATTMMALLDTFPPDLLVIGATARVLHFYHGPTKAAADIGTIMELKQIDRYCQNFLST